MKAGIAHIIDTLIGRQSRKVAFGVWGFLVGNGFLAAGKITSREWLYWSLTCASLVGFGTLLDRVLDRTADKFIAALAAKWGVSNAGSATGS